MKDFPKISVVIPVYNRENTIRYCLNSILNQSFLPFEIIVVDDCSSDKSVKIIGEYKDNLVRLICLEKRSGAQAARNKGIKESRSDWIAFMDSDDEWTPNKLEKQLEVLKEIRINPMTVIHSNCWVYDHVKQTKEIWNLPPINGEKVLRELLSFSGPMFQGMITSKLALTKIDYLDENVPSYQEWETSIRLAGYCRFIHLKEPLFIYYLHEGDRISGNRKLDIEGYQYVIDKHRNDIIQYCGVTVYNNHLLINALKAINWEYFNEALKILDKVEGKSIKILILRLLLKYKNMYKYLKWLK
jgi:glycosyltransferase involved in cell wall biosynthesis